MLQTQPSCLLRRAKPAHIYTMQCRQLHGQPLRNISTTASGDQETLTSSVTPTMPTICRPKAPLSLLPFSNLLRAYAITALSSYPLLMAPSLRLLSFVAHSPSAAFNPDRNPLLHWILKKTFYAQFCAGETKIEVQKTVKGLKDMGYKGVILAYGKEIVLAKGEKISLSFIPSEMQAVEDEVQEWKYGTLKTVQMAGEGDFIGLKFSGAGRDAMRQLAAVEPPSKAIEKATTAICELAKSRGVRLLFDAEQDAVQRGIDAWTLRFQERYNEAKSGQAVVYGTYQAYLKSTPATVAEHLLIAKGKKFTLGVKLVRGAYMASDPRELFWSSKNETDVAYDGIAEALIRRRWNDTLSSASGEDIGRVPEAALVLASHNHTTVKKAISIRKEQRERGERRIEMAYGQLMGMADEVSCELVMAAKVAGLTAFEKKDASGPKAYKYLVWGSVGECLKYLVRRAEENRDAVIRAKGTRMALRSELGRRIWG